MILLDGHSLNRKIQFRPESQSLTLEERKGQSVLTIGDGAPEIQVGDWMLDDEGPGSGTVWRVKTVERNYHGPDASTRTIQLEHIVNTLRDGVIFNEMSWDSLEADDAIRQVLALTGGLWRLGSFEPENVSWGYKFNSCTWMDALENITRTLADAWWDYDLSSIPFTLHIRSLGNQVDSEMRMSRNITGIRRTVDRSRMYTRFYPIGLNDLHITGDYLSRNEDAYGTCSKIETNQAIDNEAELRSWAQDRLRRHCEPIVTVTVSGLDLSWDTGEALDTLRLNRVCRVPLPEFGTTIQEKICRMQWPDKIKKPDQVNITLANEKEDIASIFNQQAAGSEASRSGGGRGAKKKIEEDHAWFVDTSDHVAMVAEAIIGQGPDGVDWSRVAALSVDGYGIHGRVTRAEGYLVTMSGRMDMDEERLSVAFETIDSARSEFEMTAESLRVSFENDISSARSEFQMTAESLRVSFENDISSARSEFQMTASSLRISFENDISSARSEIAANASEIALRVKKGDVATELTVECGNVTIDNGNLVVDGYIKSSALATAIACMGDLTVNGTVRANTYYLGTNAIPVSIGAGLYSAQIVQDGANGYKLQVQTYDNASWRDAGSFSRATTLSGGWSGDPATYAVTATPQNVSERTTVYQTVEGALNPNATAYAKMYHDDPSVAGNQIGGSLEMTLAEKTSSKKVDLIVNTLTKASISTEATYKAGWSGAIATIEVYPDEDTSLGYSDSQNIQVRVTNSSGNVSTISNFTITSPADRYSTGYNQGSPSSGTAGGRTSGVSSLNHDFTITRADGTTKVISIDCSSIYSTARSGYSQGTYTQVTRTAVKTSVARAHTGTLITKGHTVYLRGGSISGYKRGNVGPKISRWGSGTLYPNPNGTGGMNREWFYTDSGGTQYYSSGGSYSGYEDGGSAWVYDAGSAITYYLSSEMESVTLYTKD